MLCKWLQENAHVLNICYYLTSDVLCCHLNPREAVYLRKLWCRVCLGQRVIMVRGSCDRKKSQWSVRPCLTWGEGCRYRNHSAQQEFHHLHRKFCFLFQHLGRLSSQWAEGTFTKHKRNLFYPRSPLPLKQMPSNFVMVSIPAAGGIQTTSWNCKSTARINVFPPSKEKNDSAHIWHVRWTLEWVKRKGLMWCRWSVCFSCCSLWIVIVVSQFIVLQDRN